MLWWRGNHYIIICMGMLLSKPENEFPIFLLKSIGRHVSKNWLQKLSDQRMTLWSCFLLHYTVWQWSTWLEANIYSCFPLNRRRIKIRISSPKWGWIFKVPAIYLIAVTFYIYKHFKLHCCLADNQTSGLFPFEAQTTSNFWRYFGIFKASRVNRGK